MRILFIISMLLLSLSTQAEFIKKDWKAPNDELIILDTVSGLEWLDLSYTSSNSIQNSKDNVYRRTQDTIEAGYEWLTYDLIGWRIANEEEIKVLLNHAFPTLPVPFAKVSYYTLTSLEQEQFQEFAQLFSRTATYCQYTRTASYENGSTNPCYYAGVSTDLVGTDNKALSIGTLPVWLVRGEALPEEELCPAVVTEMTRQQALEYIQHLSNQLVDPTSTVITPLSF